MKLTQKVKNRLIITAAIGTLAASVNPILAAKEYYSLADQARNETNTLVCQNINEPATEFNRAAVYTHAEQTARDLYNKNNCE